MKFKYLFPLAFLLVSCAPKESEFKVDKKYSDPNYKFMPKSWDSKESALGSCNNEEFSFPEGSEVIKITEVNKQERSAVFTLRNKVMEEKVLCSEVGENGKINYKQLDFKWINP